MKYNSIGEQLITKAQELDPNYKPDKFNDMSEAIDVILNNTNNGGAIDLRKYINLETSSFISNKLRSEFIEEVKKGISVGYFTFPGDNMTMFFNIYLYNDYISIDRIENTCSYSGNDSYTITGMYITSMFNYYIRDNLQLLMSQRYFYTFPSGASPYQVIPSVDAEGKQQNLSIGDGLAIKSGALTSTLSNFKYGTLCLNNIIQGDETLNIELSFFDYIYDSIVSGANQLLGTSLTRDTFPQYIKQNKSIGLIISLIDNVLTLIRALSMMPYFNITVGNDTLGTYYYNCPIKKDGSSISLFLGNQEMILNTSLTFDDSFTVEYKKS